MLFDPIFLEGAYLIKPNPIIDERGWFCRTYCEDNFREYGLDSKWVQMNHSYNKKKGTLRGMHFQLNQFAEVKLVRCIRGSIYDVIIDLRENSPTLLKWFGYELSSENKTMLYIPKGFAHGFQTLEDDSEVLYCHSEFYKPGSESGLRYDDPSLNIDWPLTVDFISERDTKHKFIDSEFRGTP
jgi:dTDP-4-dehydrorhamnose 3,5-epimerase